MKNAQIGGDDKGAGGQAAHGGNQLGGGAHHIGQCGDFGRRFGVHQNGGFGVQVGQRLELIGLEFIVHHAAALPQQHVGPGLLLDMAAQMPVWGPEDFFAACMQGGNDVLPHRGGDDPVSPRLHGSAGIGVDNHGAVGVGIAELAEFIGRATQIKRASGVPIGHEYGFFRAQDFGGLAHEAHACHYQGGSGVLGAKACHLQRVAHAAPGFAGQILQCTIHVIVGHHDGIALLEQGFDALGSLALLRLILLGQHSGPGLTDAALGAAIGIGAQGGLVEFHGLDWHCLHPELFC